MNLRRLGYFQKIAELGSLNRASEVLRIAQPALTRQIHLLEEEVGTALFERTARGVRLTEAGERFRDEIVAPLRMLNFAYSNLRLSRGQVEGAVSIGMPPTIIYVLAQPLLRRLAEAEPGISLHIVEGQVDNLIEWLVGGRIDVALLYGAMPDARITDRGMLVEDLLLVGAGDSGLSLNKPIGFKTLSNFPLILPGSRHGVMAVLEKSSYITKTNLNVAYQIDSLPLTKELVGSGAGYTILPYSAVSKECEAGVLTCARIDNPSLTRQVVTAATDQCKLPRVVSRLDALIQREIATLAGSGKWPGKLLVNPDL
jgi:LysR family transcriptional regulator, nitrogen assimilation regulatory protein